MTVDHRTEDMLTRGERVNHLGNAGPGLFWYDTIRMYLPVWFGRRFWIRGLVVLLALPLAQIALIMALSPKGIPLLLIALLDFIAAGGLVALAWGLTSFGTNTFSVPVDLLDFLRRVCPIEYSAIKYKAEQSRGDVAESQRTSFRQELIHTPLTFKIFGRYVWRPVVAVVAVPLYVGLGMVTVGAVPAAHELSRSEGGGYVLSSLGVLRDLQMGMLSGSSTEHLSPKEPERHGLEDLGPVSGHLKDEKSEDPEGCSEGGGKGGSFGSGWPWGPLSWELVGMCCSFLYVVLALILLPLQISVVSILDNNLKSDEFWKKYLTSF